MRRIDLSPVVDLLPALREEWVALEFDRDGQVVNPRTGEPVTSFALLEGRHREPGARYLARITTPTYDLPEERRAEFERESLDLRQRNANHEAWLDHFARRREASVQVGTEERSRTLILREDNSWRLTFGVSDEPGHWTIDVEIRHGRLPHVEISGSLDLTARLEAERTPGCLARILGGTAAGTATLDLAAVERTGSLITAEGNANRFTGKIGVDVRTGARTWSIKGTGVLRARGLARPILWFTGRRIRRRINEALAKFWSDSESHVGAVDRQIRGIRTAIADEGGATAFVRRSLWDDEFDPGLDWERVRPR